MCVCVIHDTNGSERTMHKALVIHGENATLWTRRANEREWFAKHNKARRSTRLNAAEFKIKENAHVCLSLALTLPRAHTLSGVLALRAEQRVVFYFAVFYQNKHSIKRSLNTVCSSTASQHPQSTINTFAVVVCVGSFRLSK